MKQPQHWVSTHNTLNPVKYLYGIKAKYKPRFSLVMTADVYREGMMPLSLILILM